ncbi:MAG: 23S rRNA (uracil(1939)-C(5))-methyltransferase RlmD [Myxococcota bacterium]
MKLPAKGDLIEMALESLDDEGLGAARVMLGDRRLKAHVKDGVPGDRIVARIHSRVRDKLFAGVETVLEASPDRMEPACEHLRAVAPCGGCALQGMSYEAQLRHKAERVRRHLGSHGVVTEVLPTLPAPTTFHHRHKMELTFGRDRAGRLAVGLHPAGYRWEIITTSRCLLLSPLAASLLDVVLAACEARGLDGYDPRTQAGALRNLVIREGKRTEQRLVELVTGSSLAPDDGKALIDALAEAVGDAVPSWVWTIVDAERGRPTRLEVAYARGAPALDEILELPGGRRLTLAIHPRAFFQPHPLAAERLIAEVLRRLPPDGRVADLYCGTGTLALAVAPFVTSVVGVELVPEAVENARENAARNALANATFIAGDVAQVLADPTHAARFAGLDAVLLDPPRSGLSPQALDAVNRLGPASIVYVSCNPASLGRDLAALGKLGYALDGPIQPVDLFPHSPHVESVALVRKARVGYTLTP